jgi:hypothetical protein
MADIINQRQFAKRNPMWDRPEHGPAIHEAMKTKDWVELGGEGWTHQDVFNIRSTSWGRLRPTYNNEYQRQGRWDARYRQGRVSIKYLGGYE